MALAATMAAGAAGAGSTLGWHFSNRQPNLPTALNLDIVYRRPSEPNAKPAPIRHLVIKAPAGTRFQLATVPACRATDQQIQLEGRAACPAGSQIGSGKLITMEGLGPPIDPVVYDGVIFNDGVGMVETFSPHGAAGPVVAIDRIAITGQTLVGNPPAYPGGPPDGRTAVREIKFSFPASTEFIRTPNRCPNDAVWRATGTFNFADGSTQSVVASTPCERSGT